MLAVYTELDAQTRAYLLAMPLDHAPAAYQPRLARKTHPHARAQSIAGLWLLRQALELTGHDASALADIDFDPHNRPHLATGPAFSISHSDHFAACAITDTPGGAVHVGLDIEEPRTIAPQRLARLASNKTERAVIAKQPERFFDFWCAREATVKATGRVGLKRIRQIRLVGYREAWLDNQRWALQPLALAPGLTACLACDSPTETVRIRQLAVSPSD